MKVREVIRRIEADGWYLDRQRAVTGNSNM